jgi:hypothetical protein
MGLARSLLAIAYMLGGSLESTITGRDITWKLAGSEWECGI